MTMKVTNFCFNSNDAESFKGLHAILEAFEGLSIANVFIQQNAKDPDFLEYCKTVNQNDETMCLFPKHRITLISTNAFKKSRNAHKCIIDCFNANELFVKSNHIVFIFDDIYRKDRELILEAISSSAEGYQFEFTKQISTNITESA